MARVSHRHFVYKDLEWWAENGLIYMEDHKDNDFHAVTVRDALERAAALTVERRRIDARARSSSHASGNRVAAEDRAQLQTAIEGLIEACKDARKQGDPSDPKVIEDLRKQRKKNILIPGENIAGQRIGEIILG